MERTERLLDLVALLLDAKEPVPWVELRESFPEDYGQGSDDATERKFERDKAELLELGIPITYVQGDEDRKDGYVITRDAYYLPDPGFSKEEMAVLYAAGSAALTSGGFPGREDLAHALRKIGFFAGDALPTPRVRMELGPQQQSAKVAELLQTLWEAAAARKWVQLDYTSPRPGGGETTARKVDPYGLVLRRGIWSLVGFCHLRQAPRTFQLHRMSNLTANTARPKSADFTVPEGFNLDSYVAQVPWEVRMHPELSVTLLLRGELASRADRLLPHATCQPSGVEAPAGGAPDLAQTQVTVKATYLDGLLRYVLSLAPHATVLGPEQAVTRWKQMATKVLEHHQAPLAAATGPGVAPVPQPPPQARAVS